MGAPGAPRTPGSARAGSTGETDKRQDPDRHRVRGNRQGPFSKAQSGGAAPRQIGSASASRVGPGTPSWLAGRETDGPRGPPAWEPAHLRPQDLPEAQGRGGAGRTLIPHLARLRVAVLGRRKDLSGSICAQREDDARTLWGLTRRINIPSTAASGRRHGGGQNPRCSLARSALEPPPRPAPAASVLRPTWRGSAELEEASGHP